MWPDYILFRSSHSLPIACLQREIGDKRNESMDLARQLLPLPKKFLEIVTNDPYKGKSISVMDPKKGVSQEQHSHDSGCIAP